MNWSVHFQSPKKNIVYVIVLLFLFYRCLSSRWDKPAQPKQSADVRPQESKENSAHSVPLSGVLSTAGPNNTMSEPPETAGKPQGGVEMAAAMAAKINAMLMAKGKLLTPPPLLAKVINRLLYIVSNGVFENFIVFAVDTVFQAPSVPVPAIPEEMVITEVDINDVPLNCRDLLTKVKTQEEVSLKNEERNKTSHWGFFL